MSAVQDVRQVLQDFLAPELWEITARLDALEKKVDSHHADTMAAIRGITDYTHVIERISRLEAQHETRQ